MPTAVVPTSLAARRAPSASRSPMITRAPRAASACAVARPIPRAPPVMTTTLFCSDTRIVTPYGSTEPASVPKFQNFPHDRVLLLGAREHLHLLAHAEPLACGRLRTGELTQSVLAVESSEPAVADTTERQRRHADEREHRVDRGAAGAQLRRDLRTSGLGEHG